MINKRLLIFMNALLKSVNVLWMCSKCFTKTSKTNTPE